ncbi:MAG: NADH-quinone oxidoreductase subunit L [Vicinamibacteria bacterium]
MLVAPWMVLFMPLFGFITLAFLGGLAKKQGKHQGMMAIATGCVFISFLLAALVMRSLLTLPPDAEGLRMVAPALPHNWIDVAGFTIPMQLLIDPLSATLMLVISGIGSLIHLYSIGYMSHDEERIRYFSYLNLFTFFMLVLVTGASLALMFVGWEGVGLCSYLLIGFWFKKKSASDAGKKAFIVNRIGDAGLIIGMALAAAHLGTLDLMEISKGVIPMGKEEFGVFGPLTLIAIALFIGACGKSAQIPLHVWLPDAMEGPTPVSALIHAATMVTAGIYMVARLGTLFAHAETAMWIVASIGAITAFVAATIAVVQNDIKKVLAYSTVSQLGYMFLACGVGAFGVGVFHLFTHAFFKALMFLGSGSVIHGLSGEQDMRQMGGLRKRMPWTFVTFTAGWLAIIGFPYFSGYFSKEEILMAAFPHSKVLFSMALLTAGLTAFYMTRLYVMTFLGDYRGGLEKTADHGTHSAVSDGTDAHAGHGNDAHGTAAHKVDDHSHGHGGIHESPAVMLIPLFILAIGSVLAGYVHVPAFVEPAIRFGEEVHHLSWMPVIAFVVAFTGAWLAYLMYGSNALKDVPAKMATKYAGVKDLLDAKWGFDDAYDSFVRNGTNGVVDISERVLWKKVDAGWIDGAVNGLGRLAVDFAEGGSLMQSGLVRGSALSILAGAVAILTVVLWSNR